MIYITYVQPPRYHQLTFEEMMAGITVNELSELKVGTSSGTRTVCVTNVPQKLREIAANYQLNLKLALFNDKYKAMTLTHPVSVRFRQAQYPNKTNTKTKKG